MRDDDDLMHFHCEKCGEKMKISESKAGATVDCTGCGVELIVPGTPPAERVFVTDVRISWGNMLELIFKFSICAAIIGILISIVGFVVSAVLAGFLHSATRP